MNEESRPTVKEITRAGATASWRFVATLFLILWVAHDLWIYGIAKISSACIFPAIAGAIGGTLFDLRVWMLVIGVVLLWLKQAHADA